MPYTPFHFGASSCIALSLKRYIDFPVFIFANIIVDLEPLVILTLDLDRPLHGPTHTFLIGSLLGILWAIIVYLGKDFVQTLMNFVWLPYEASFRKMILSGILGVWLHVLLDAPLYSDIRPFFPLNANPFYGLTSESSIYVTSALLFLPAMVLYGIEVVSFRRKDGRPIA